MLYFRMIRTPGEERCCRFVFRFFTSFHIVSSRFEPCLSLLSNLVTRVQFLDICHNDRSMVLHGLPILALLSKLSCLLHIPNTAITPAIVIVAILSSNASFVM